MNLSNRIFKDNRTGEVLKVIDSFENIAILENKTKIDARRLMDPNHFTEQVDPTSFFNNQNAYDSLFEKIKTIPTDRIPDDKGEIRPTVSIDSSYKPPAEDDSAVIYGSIEDEREELAKKYGVSIDNKQTVAKQNEAFAKILEDSPEIAELPVAQSPAPKSVEVENIQRIEIDRESGAVSVDGRQAEPVYSKPKEDPIYSMFRGVKRSVEFSIDLKLENKIPRLDFIEMMEDSYEKSIIDFLADEFTKELLKDPKSLRESIKAKIREMVYEKPKPARKAAARKPVAKKTAAKITAKKHDALNIEKDPMLAKDLEQIIAPKKKKTVKKETEKQ